MRNASGAVVTVGDNINNKPEQNAISEQRLPKVVTIPNRYVQSTVQIDERMTI